MLLYFFKVPQSTTDLRYQHCYLDPCSIQTGIERWERISFYMWQSRGNQKTRVWSWSFPQCLTWNAAWVSHIQIFGAPETFLILKFFKSLEYLQTHKDMHVRDLTLSRFCYVSSSYMWTHRWFYASQCSNEAEHRVSSWNVCAHAVSALRAFWILGFHIKGMVEP